MPRSGSWQRGKQLEQRLAQVWSSARAGCFPKPRIDGMLVAPEEFILHFPPFYLTIFAILTAFKNKLERFALGIPRGFAKTTFIKLLCVWYILFSHKKFILIVGAAEDLAVNTLADICDFLSSPNIRLS